MLLPGYCGVMLYCCQCFHTFRAVLHDAMCNMLTQSTVGLLPRNCKCTLAACSMTVVDTGVEWANSLDSSLSSAQAYSVASGRAFSCAIFGSALLHRLSTCFGLHQYHCGLFVWYVRSIFLCSRSVAALCNPGMLSPGWFCMQVVGPSMQPGSMALCVWLPS